MQMARRTPISFGFAEKRGCLNSNRLYKGIRTFSKAKFKKISDDSQILKEKNIVYFRILSSKSDYQLGQSVVFVQSLLKRSKSSTNG